MFTSWQRSEVSVVTRNAPSKCFSLVIRLSYVIGFDCSWRRLGMTTDSHIHHVVSRNYFLAYSASVVQKYVPPLSQHIYLRWYICWLRSGICHYKLTSSLSWHIYTHIYVRNFCHTLWRNAIKGSIASTYCSALADGIAAVDNDCKKWWLTWWKTRYLLL